MRTYSTLWLGVVASATIACGPTGEVLVNVVDAGADVPTAIDRPVIADTPSAMDRPATDVALDRPTSDVRADVPASTDRPMTTDTPVTTDRPMTTDVPVDVPPASNTCAAAAIIDLNMAGMRMGETTRYVGTTATAPERGILTAPCGTSDHYQLALRYTPRASTRLRISTNNPGTAAMFDSVVWVQSACAPLAMGIAALGCNDDGGEMPNTLASIIRTTSPLTAGTPVFILVGGYGTGMGNRGAFELTVTELTVVPVGMACNPETNVCAMGSSCVGAAMMQRCVADGAAGGACRTGMGAVACDMGLTCSTGRCQAAIPIGMACGGMITAPCITGSSCQGTTGMQRCTADGTAGGRCRTAMGAMLCDMGLTCSGATSGICGAPIAAGMPCNVPGGTGVCATGTACRGPTGAQRCLADGTAGGRCRTAMGSVACDMGLTCTAATCVATVAVGGACDVNSPGQVCAMGSSCAPMGAGTTCQRDSTAAGTPCNDVAPLCSMGLTCDGTDSGGVCRRAGTSGMACDLTFNSVACPMGTGCLGTSATAATCTATRMETEPNNSVMMPQTAITAGAVFAGGVGGATDPMDCYGVTVPINGTVVVETSTPGHPGCDANDTLAILSTAAGVEVTRNDDGFNRGLCSYFSAPRLAAGAYVVCVRAFGSAPIASYSVSISVYGP